MVNTESPLERLERKIHPWTAFVVLPIFALVSAGGLVLGKLVGIVAAAWLAVRIGAASLPDGVSWRHIAGVSLLGGIGFTVPLFITELAFADPEMVATAKLSVLVTSALAGGIGFAVLKTVVRRTG
ncbi:MAG TPA: Na+/H+ antiporter NhaA [Longimicrobiales bacterium]|nr:Na+/H+ antiporter NhaA [Longimicrobiales bacterium]